MALRTSRISPIVVTIEPGTARLASSLRPKNAAPSSTRPGTMTKNGHAKAPTFTTRPSRNRPPSTMRAMPRVLSRSRMSPPTRPVAPGTANLTVVDDHTPRPWRSRRADGGRLLHLSYEVGHRGPSVHEAVLDEHL